MGSTTKVELTDEALMARYQRGDLAAFSALVRRHQRGMFNFLLRQSRGMAPAQDLVQEVFLKIVENAHSFRQGARFTTWAYTIAHNACIDHFRRAANRRHSSLDQEGDSDSSVPLRDRVEDLHPGGSVERSAIAGEIQTRVLGALEVLSDEQKEVFLLRHMVGLPFQEIAEITGVGENTVKSRMRYALEKMQEALTDFEEYARALR